MSLRYFSIRLYKNGRYLLRAFYQRQFSGNIVEEVATNSRRIAVQPAGIGNRAKSLFADTLLTKTTSTLNVDLRRRATKRLLCGKKVPLFSLVGVSLASGSTLLSKEDELEALCLEIRDAVQKLKYTTLSLSPDEAVLGLEEISLERLTIGQPFAQGCAAVIFTAKIKEERDGEQNRGDEYGYDRNEFPYALKMMFNYDIESNAMSILRAMYREAVPAIKVNFGEDNPDWADDIPERKVRLPPHPNVITVYNVFTGYVPDIAGTMNMCPSAMPRRINPRGLGRNMSMFLLMKRYRCSLDVYLRTHRLSTLKSVLLLTQLLEAVTHISLYGVAHRDLKCNNILLDMELADETPILVVSDFGCCLADYLNGLQVPYKTPLFDKGGNAALMAPEIVTQTPGTFSVLNYTKSDVWAVGAIAYEIFGQVNPFYMSAPRREEQPPLNGPGNNKFRIQGDYAHFSKTYKVEDLPKLNDKVPQLIRRLVEDLLNRNPKQRPSAELAANICQLYLWAPTKWIRGTIMPSSNEIIQWLLCLTTKVLYEGRLPESFAAFAVAAGPVQAETKRRPSRRTRAEYILISSFLSRARLTVIKKALRWIQSDNF